MLVWLRPQVRPFGEAAEVRVTVPLKCSIGATVTVEAPVALALTTTLVGFAVIVKYCAATLNDTVAAWDREPLVPVTVTVKVPLADAVQDSVEAPEPATEVGDTEHESPVEGLTLAARLIVPLNPFEAVTVIADVAVPPTVRATFVGLAPTVKSWTVKVTVVEWDTPPPLPVTTTE